MWLEGLGLLISRVWKAGFASETAFSLLLSLYSLLADHFRKWQQQQQQQNPLLSNPTYQLPMFVSFRQQRHFIQKHLLMEASQYSDDPDSALGDEMYFHPSSLVEKAALKKKPGS